MENLPNHHLRAFQIAGITESFGRDEIRQHQSY
jgi:hypothetical protein